MRHEYDSILEVLPSTCTTVPDIGCGVADIDAFIQWRYGDQPIKFYLPDKSRVAKSVYYLFKPAGAFYNSLEVAEELLTRNGIARHAIHVLKANEANTIPIDTAADVVLSLLSCGFHYPVATYVEAGRTRLDTSSVVILDMRKATDGLVVLQRAFRHVDAIKIPLLAPITATTRPVSARSAAAGAVSLPMLMRA